MNEAGETYKGNCISRACNLSAATLFRKWCCKRADGTVEVNAMKARLRGTVLNSPQCVIMPPRVVSAKLTAVP